MFRTGQGTTIPIVFQSRFKRVSHPFSKRFRKSNFSKNFFIFNQTKFSILATVPCLSEYLFNNKTKYRLSLLQNDSFCLPKSTDIFLAILFI